MIVIEIWDGVSYRCCFHFSSGGSPYIFPPTAQRDRLIQAAETANTAARSALQNDRELLRLFNTATKQQDLWIAALGKKKDGEKKKEEMVIGKVWKQ